MRTAFVKSPALPGPVVSTLREKKKPSSIWLHSEKGLVDCPGLVVQLVKCYFLERKRPCDARHCIWQDVAAASCQRGGNLT